MGLKFRKRIKLNKFIHANISISEKNGVTTSATVGVDGANVNIQPHKDKIIKMKRATLGVPGSGIRYDKNLDTKPNKDKEPSKPQVGIFDVLRCLIAVAFIAVVATIFIN